VNLAVGEVVIVECIAACSNIALLVEVPSKVVPFHNLGQAKDPDVKLAHRRVHPVWSSEEQRLVDILLDNPVLVRLARLQELLNCVEIGQHDYTFTSVCVLSWFADPN